MSFAVLLDGSLLPIAALNASFRRIDRGAKPRQCHDALQRLGWFHGYLLHSDAHGNHQSPPIALHSIWRPLRWSWHLQGNGRVCGRGFFFFFFPAFPLLLFKVLFVVRLMMRSRSCVTQVETIGDAYCAAGGLHRVSSTHAQQIAWMALCMLEVCRFHQTHDGQPIQVSFACRFLLFFSFDRLSLFFFFPSFIMGR